eukprot:9834897-Alexandrium_andersonii.AAC.1
MAVCGLVRIAPLTGRGRIADCTLSTPSRAGCRTRQLMGRKTHSREVLGSVDSVSVVLGSVDRF